MRWNVMAIDQASEYIWICPHGPAEGGVGWVQNQYFIHHTRGLVNDQDKYNHNDKRIKFKICISYVD